MTAADLDPETIRMRQIETEMDASDAGFPGSPTIRVGGRDVGGEAGEPAGLTCRIYHLRDGRVSALPDRADVREALVAR
ncbi:MAG: hypothetical protein ACR2OC_03065 [Solirubrobacterales bacterium]